MTNDPMGTAALDVRDKADAAGVVLVTGSIKALVAWLLCAGVHPFSPWSAEARERRGRAQTEKSNSAY